MERRIIIDRTVFTASFPAVILTKTEHGVDVQDTSYTMEEVNELRGLEYVYQVELDSKESFSSVIATHYDKLMEGGN